MSEVEGGGESDEERAEAEKFNELVDEGKLTPDEASQIEKGKTPEEVEAERAAMEKVVDIKDENIGVHFAYRRKIDKIIKQGILSTALAERAKKVGIKDVDVEPNYDANEKLGDKSVFYLRKQGWFSGRGWGDIAVILNTDMIKQTPNEYEGDNREGYRAYLRVNPRAIIGIGLTSYMDYNDEYSEEPNKFRGIPENIKDLAIGSQTPIYGRDLSLKWPKEMAYDEVQQFVAERDAKKKVEKGERQEE